MLLYHSSISHPTKKSNPCVFYEKRGLAAYKYWSDVISIRDAIVCLYPSATNNAIDIPVDRYPILLHTFEDLKIHVEYRKNYKYEGNSGASYDIDGETLIEPYMNLWISYSLSLVGIEKVLCNEINHLYAMYQMPNNKKDEDATIKALLGINGNLNYDVLMNLRDTPTNNDVAYCLDILYML